LVPTQWRSGTRASLQKFDGAMAAWLAELGYTKIKALNYDQLLKTTLLSRDEAVHAALRFVACVGRVLFREEHCGSLGGKTQRAR
jgi:hypothetical protein